MYKNDEKAAVYEMERQRLYENSYEDFCEMCGGSVNDSGETICIDCRAQLLRGRLHGAISVLDDDVRAIVALIIDDYDLKTLIEEE